VFVALPFRSSRQERLAQRYCTKFCQKLGDTQAETIRDIQQTFRDDAMGVTQIKQWFNCFKDGRRSAESQYLTLCEW
jgi:hypothetical protein